ncbi:ATP-binding protein [Desulfospira joergensenii]|uniref:ATP-binding protein n=1 Tax=Desulfospira joergensenii TaxID=53329 RepID=UPI0003B46255|nr:transporter substrate-binding domain-containing protein [Desulfospira joergensenii]
MKKTYGKALLFLFSFVLILTMGSCQIRKSDFLTPEERTWLRQHGGELEMLIGYEDPPYGYYDSKGRYIGIVMDHLAEIEGLLGIKFAARNFKTWDELMEYSKTGRKFILLGISRTDKRVEYLSFTDPLIKEVYVIVTGKDSGADTMKDLDASRVCSTANYAVNEYIARYFPQITPEYFPDSLDGLRAVATDNCDAMIISQMSASYLIENQGIANLKIAGETGYVNRLGAAVSIQDPILFSIVDKAVDRISPERQREIYRKWLNTGSSRIPGSVWAVLSVGAGLALALVTLLWIWSISLRRQVDKKTRQIRASEEKFRSYVENAPGGIFVADENRNLLEVNRAAEKLTGYDSGELQGMDLMALVSPKDHKRAEKHFETVWKTGKTTGDLSFNKKDGSLNEWTIDAVKLSNTRILGFVTDITHRKRAEEERLKLGKLESVGILAGGIAHDFNNVLTGLFGNIEMVKMLLPDHHESQKFLKSALGSMETATHLTNQLLTFAKGGDPVKETLSIGEVIAETARFSIRGSRAKLETRMARDLWPVEADKGQLSQVIGNLVVNAQQAMPTGGKITITAGNVNTREGRFVCIEIQDRGVGIAPQYIEKIFDPYFTTKQHGSGLGLAIIHSIIRKHNGEIRVDSRLNQGTTFTILLPVSEKPRAEETENRVEKTEGPEVSHFRVLILDDEPAVRDLLGEMMERLGHRVSYAAEGQEAVLKYQDARQKEDAYDLVIADLTIPGGMGGQRVAEEILSLDPQARIIVSSGYSTDPVMANFQEYGFKARLAKPYLFLELKKALVRAFEA